MNIGAFTEDCPGELVNTGGDLAFNPNPLPPELDQGNLVTALTNATTALGRLEGIGPRIENSRMLISPFMRKEAVLSSRIEGTRATLSDVYAYEAGQENFVAEASQPDVREVMNYVESMERGLNALESTRIDVDLIQSLHETLMSDVRGSEKNPGEFRERQNYIGTAANSVEEARYIPPSPELIWPSMRQLEQYIRDENEFHPLIEIGLVHYQFETIDPFMDGNGRVGRLLISLMLQENGLLPEPYLYLSSYFNERRDEYTDLLLAVSQRGAWHDWIEFFLEGVHQQADEAHRRAQRLLDLRARYRKQYQNERSENVLRLVMELFSHPYVTVPEAKEKLTVSYPTANRIVDKLESDGVLEEQTGNSRNRMYRAGEIYRILTLPGEAL